MLKVKKKKNAGKKQQDLVECSDGGSFQFPATTSCLIKCGHTLLASATQHPTATKGHIPQVKQRVEWQLDVDTTDKCGDVAATQQKVHNSSNLSSKASSHCRPNKRKLGGDPGFNSGALQKS